MITSLLRFVQFLFLYYLLNFQIGLRLYQLHIFSVSFLLNLVIFLVLMATNFSNLTATATFKKINVYGFQSIFCSFPIYVLCFIAYCILILYFILYVFYIVYLYIILYLLHCLYCIVSNIFSCVHTHHTRARSKLIKFLLLRSGLGFFFLQKNVSVLIMCSSSVFFGVGLYENGYVIKFNSSLLQ